jgi:hypothetical protein
MWFAPLTVAMQRHDKHSSTILEAVFSMWSVPSGYLEDNWGDPGSCQLRGYSSGRRRTRQFNIGSVKDAVTLRVL